MKRTGSKIVAACAAAALAATLALPAAFGAEGAVAQAPGAAGQSAGASSGAAAAPAAPGGSGAATEAAGQEGAADGSAATEAAAAEGVAALEAQAPAADAAAARVSPVRVSLKADLGRLEAPYGVDVEEWLAEQDVFDTRPALDGDALRALFAGGKPLKAMGSGGSSYPGPGSRITLTWGTALDPILSPVSMDAPSLGNVRLTMGAVEPWLLDGVDLGEPAEDSQARLTTDGPTTRLWLSGGATLDGRFDRTARFEFLEPAPSVSADPEPGDFSRATPVLRLPATGPYPRQVYARVDGDWTFNQGTPEERRLAQGQIVKLPLVCLDQTPGALEGDARMSAGNEVAGVLYAQAGTVLTLDVEDQDDPSLPAAGAPDRVSGISKAVLKHNGSPLAEAVPVPASPHPQVSFVLDAPGAYDVADLNVELVDFAGNAVPLPLPTVLDATGNAFASPVATLQIVADAPTVSVTYQGSSNAWGCYQSRTAVVQVNDPHFGALSTWYAGLTPAQAAGLDAVVTFQNVADPASDVEVDLGQLVAGGGRATATLSGDGQYVVKDAGTKPAYAGVVPGLGSAWDAGSDLAPFTLDAQSPAGGQVTFSIWNKQLGGCLFYSGAATVEMRVNDALSGVDPASVKLSYGGVDQGVSAREDPDGSCTLTWDVPYNAGLVDLSSVQVTFADRAGNRAPAIDLKSHPLKNAPADELYVSDAQPSIDVAFDNDDVRNGRYYNAHRTATVTVRDPAFGYLHASEPGKEVVTLTHNGAGSKTTAGQFAPVPGDPDAWTATVACDDEGTFDLYASYESPTGVPADDYVGESFVIDTVKPRVDLLTLSPANGLRWGVVFAPDAARGTFVLNDDTSGVDASTIALTEGGAPQLPGITSSGRLAMVTWNVAARDSLVPLSSVVLTFADMAGNVAPLPADQIANVLPGGATGLFVGTDKPEISVSFDNDDVRNGSYYNAHRTATVAVDDAAFGFVHASDPGEIVATLDHDGVSSHTTAGQFAQSPDDPNVWTAQVPCTDEGAFSLTASYTSPTGVPADSYAGEPFTVDTVAPRVDALTLSPSDGMRWGVVFAPDAASGTFALNDDTSGVDVATVGLAEGGLPVEPACSSDGLSATVTWNVAARDSLVPLSSVVLVFRDMAGNPASPLDFGAFENVLPSGATGLFVGAEQPQLSVSFDNDDVRNGKYYNAHRTATVTVDDAAFEFVHAFHAQSPVATLHHDGERFVTAGDFERSEDDPNVWTAQVPCTDEGAFSLEARYTSPTGLEAEPYAGEEFVVDTVAPRIESVSLSPEHTQRWGVLFAADAGQAAFVLADDTSGVDEAAVFLSEKGELQVLPCSTDENLVTTAFWGVSTRNGLIPLSAVSLSLADKAGNPVKMESLDGFENRNLEDVHGLFVDDAAPEIAVSFDNDDVRNGKYYNAGRTAAVTVTEASFAFVRDNDPRRAVAVLHRDGSAREVRAEEFENPSGDGITWVVAVPCEDDGTYRLDVDFTDPSGKEARPYRGGEFVVDKTAPLIMLTFDNEESQGGGYFKAPRTATVTVYEENFSADLASISATAADAAGNAAGAPGASAWTEVAKTWQASVYFGQELHYTLEAACTDLAGNAAEAVSEPEFVIDLTAPSVRIDRVADRSAYKDEVEPLVFFEDVNFEPYLAEVSIVGANRGDGLYFRSEDALTETTRTVDFADFDYKLENDDVYTLTATVRDKAGNEASQQVTFSVNRFGSNYRLSDETRALMGTFVKKGQDVVVTETNVSGLAASSVSVVRNDEVRRLAEGEDYRMEAVGDQSSWSQYTYTLPASLFQEDGYYRVLLSSVDAAGSLSENLMEGKNEDRTDALEMTFAVDGTSPQASIGGVESGTAYYAPARGVQVYAADNLEAESAALFVDGEQAASWNADQLAGLEPLEYDLPAFDGTQSVRLEVRDRAGNTTAVTTDGIVVTNDLLRYILETPAILYPIIAALVIAAGALLMLAARAMERRRRQGGQES